MQLSDSNGNILGKSTNLDALPELINQTLDAGIYTVQVSAQSAVNYSLSLTAQPNLHNDLMWRNDVSDETATWFVNNAAFSSAAFTTKTPALGTNPDWKAVGTGDFNQDGETDLVWRNDVSDETGVWFLKDNALDSAVIIDKAPLLGKDASGWKIVGTGDFNSDGNLDLVWQNYAAGEVGVWFLKGTSFESASYIANAPQLPQNSANWKVVGTGDFNSDSNLDLVWRNDVSDQTGFWFLKGKTFESAAILDNAPLLGKDASGWKIVGTGDFSNDGNPELLWQNQAAGQVGVWSLKGTSFESAKYIENAPALGANSNGWQLVGTATRYTEPLIQSSGTLQSAFNIGSLTATANYSDRLSANGTGYYQFTLASSQSVNLSVENQAGTATVELLDGQGAIVANPTQGVAAGTYYVKVVAGVTDAEYSLTVSGNAPPVLDLNGAADGINFATTFTEERGAIAISNSLTVSDADDKMLSGATVTIANLQDGPAESLAVQLSGTEIVANYSAGVLSLSGSASVADYQKVLRSITYNNTSTSPNTIARQITMRVNDGFDDSAIATSTIQIVPVNDSPRFTSGGTLATILEDAANPAGESISTLFAGKFSDPDAGSSFAGVAVFGSGSNPDTEGKWQYSIGGSTWSDIGIQSDGLVLSASTVIRFLPIANYNGAPQSPDMYAIDNTYTDGFSTDSQPVKIDFEKYPSPGGSTPFSSDSEKIITTVTAVNDAPSFVKGDDITVVNTAGTQTVSGWATQLNMGAADEEQTLTFAVTTDKPELFEVAPSIDATGKLIYTPKTGVTGSATISVTLKDDGGTGNGGVDTSAAQTFTISLTAQALPKDFTRQFGTSNHDIAQSVVIDSAGNAYVSGFTYGTFAGYTNAGGAFVAKYDNTGTQVSLKQFSVAASIGSVTVDSAGNAYVTGYTDGDLAGTNAGGQDAFVAKYDSTGTQEWIKQFGTSDYDIALSVAIDSAGNAYVTGYTSGDLAGTNAGRADAFLQKVVFDAQ